MQGEDRNGWYRLTSNSASLDASRTGNPAHLVRSNALILGRPLICLSKTQWRPYAPCQRLGQRGLTSGLSHSAISNLPRTTLSSIKPTLSDAAFSGDGLIEPLEAYFGLLKMNLSPVDTPFEARFFCALTFICSENTTSAANSHPSEPIC